MKQTADAVKHRLAPGHRDAKKILIVDDEPAIQRVLAVWLSAEGYACVTAENGRQALEHLSTDDFDLLICDIMMPGISGLELLPLVKELRPHLPAVMMTALDDRETATRALEVGAYGYLIKPFDQNEVSIAAAGALERSRLLRISEEYQAAIEAQVQERTAEIRHREEEITIHLLAAAEYRNQETGRHIRRVGLSAALIARALGLPSIEVDNLRLAAPMHDIGKIGVPDAVLLKAGKFTDDEYQIMKTHTTIGARILDGTDIPLLRMARDIAMMHHERWDGSGYPTGLSSEEITIHARIVSLVDVLDALTSDRIYRSAFSETEALNTMVAGKGKLFDPQIFTCMMDIYPELREKGGQSPFTAVPLISSPELFHVKQA